MTMPSIRKMNKNDYGIARMFRIESGECNCVVYASKENNNIKLKTIVCESHNSESKVECCPNCEHEYESSDSAAYMDNDFSKALIEALGGLL